MKSFSLASRRGHFSTLNELTTCIRASMLVPGLTGPLLCAPKGELADSAWRESSPPPPPPPQVLGGDDSPNTTGPADVRGTGKNIVSKAMSRATSWAVGEWRRAELREMSGEDGEGAEDPVGSQDGAAEAVDSAHDDVAGDSELLLDALVFEPLPYR